MRKLLVFNLLFLLTFSSALFTQSRQVRVTKKERRIALVIGNGAYRVSPLRNPVNDANDIAVVLKKKGFDVTYKTNASQRTMKNAIRVFGEKLKLGGTGLFYFAGHGMQVKGVNYLIPVGSEIRTEDEIEFEAVDANRILRKMESAGNKMNIVILDACRDNPFARSFRSNQNGLARMDAPSGSLIVYSTAPGKTAADGKGRNGIFTKHLLKMIKETNLEIGRLLRKVRENVINETNSIQVPWESSSLIGDFYFSENLDIKVDPQSTALIYKPDSAPPAQDIDVSNFFDEAKKNRLDKKKDIASWDSWQIIFQRNLDKLKKLDGNKDVSASSKKNAWQQLLESYSKDNPYSEADEQMREYARERVNFWEKIISGDETFDIIPSIQLRSSYRTLGKNEIKSMIKNYGFFHPLVNKSKTFRNKYEKKIIDGDSVVIDHITGLMWHQGGSYKMNYEKAKLWIRDLNNRGYASYNDWRLPTVEESDSLLESKKKNGALYIDPLFSQKQRKIWTGDPKNSRATWVVYFSSGYVRWCYLDNKYYVRPVRSIR